MRTETAGAAAELEQTVLAPHAGLLEGLEYAGPTQARRSFVLMPEAFDCEAVSEGLLLRFVLGPGEYATSLLADRFALCEGAR